MTVHPAEHGLRLDKALLCWLPLWGLRARRRLCEQGLVLLEGKTCTPACKVRAGQQIHIAVAPEKTTGLLDAQGETPLAQGETPLAQGETPLAFSQPHTPVPHIFSHANACSVLVTHSAHVAAVFKPAGLHTAHLAGSLAPSLEDDLEALLRDILTGDILTGDILAGDILTGDILAGDILAGDILAGGILAGGILAGDILAGGMLAGDLLAGGITDQPAFATPQLLNRLDQGTSGLVLVALTPKGQHAWRMAEARGAMDKRYVAVVASKKPFHDSGNELSLRGNELAAPCTVRFSLDTCHRAITRVLATDSPDPLRHTRVIPLGILPQGAAFFPETEAMLAATGGKLQLVGCCIRKGARHQIRAHLAALGFPLAGDPVYGQPLSTPFYLHHGAVAFGDFAAHHIPHWFALLPADLRQAAQSFLQTASNTATG